MCEDRRQRGAERNSGDAGKTVAGGRLDELRVAMAQ
jgi:hypothetical protein